MVISNTTTHESDNVLLVLGSGPGIARATASVFARRGIHKIALVARNSAQLALDKEAVEQAAKEAGETVEVRTWVADIADRQAIDRTLSQMSSFGAVEIVFFNAARVQPSTLLEFPAEQIEYDFKITVTALYETAKWAIPRLCELAARQPNSRPSLLVTNSLLYVDPVPELFSLSLTKAAQRSLVLSLDKTYGKEGIHIALVSVGGPVAPENKVLNPDNIALKIWELFMQSASERTYDVVLVEDQ